MSYYKDIYNDFPLRCGKLWKCMQKQSKLEKYEVTFMLMVASSGLVAPWEHLKHDALGSDEVDRPPAFTPGNDDHYREVLKAFQKEIDGELNKSKFFNSLNLDKWRLRTIVNRNQIIGYLEGHNGSMGSPYKVRSARNLIKVFRNSLAHNNFHAFNRGNASEIDEIAFFSEIHEYNPMTNKREVVGYNVISLSHRDFAIFLDAWFDLLESISKSKDHLRKVLIYVLQHEDEEKKSHGY
jgi:hypothetical protein